MSSCAHAIPVEPPKAYVDFHVDGSALPVVEEEVFEMQSLHPYKMRWRESSRPWCNRCGGDPSSPFFSLPVPFDPASTCKDNDCGMKRGWKWQSRWTIDKSYTPCDAEGWTYGMSITAMNTHLADGTHRIKPRPYDILRRRRWVRRRARVPIVLPGSTSDETDDDVRFYRVLRLDSALSQIMHVRSTPLHQMYNLKFHSDEIAMEGWLGKYGSFTHNWKLRYFLLRRDTNTLVYLQDTSSLLQLGQVPITTHTAVEIVPSPCAGSNSNRHQFAFELVNGARRWRLNAPTDAIKMHWVNAIHDIMFQRQPPYSLECASMCRTRPDYHSACVLPHLAALESTFEDASAMVLTVFDDLLNQPADVTNLATTATVQSLLNQTSPVAPSAELVAFREQVAASLSQLHKDIVAPLKANPTKLTLLGVNRAKEDLYIGCTALVDSIKSFQRPSSNSVVKRRSGEATRRLSIPEAWLLDTPPSAGSITVPAPPENLVDIKPPPPLPITKSSSVAKPNPGDMPSTTRKSNAASHPAKDVPVRQPCGRANAKALLRRVFHRAEHLDRGVGGLVVWADEHDIGSLIAYSLVSPMYVDLLQQTCGAISVLHEHEGKMTLRTPQIYREIKNPSCHHFKCHVVLDKTSATIAHTNTLSTSSDQTEANASTQDRAPDGLPTISGGDGGDGGSSGATTVTVYFATQFHCLRQVIEPGNLGFLNAIAKSAPWETSGGKSGAFFSLSHDQQFVLKGVAATEFNMFVHFAPTYFKYIAEVAEKKASSCLAKIVGAFKIKLHGHTKPMFVFVMECSIFGFPFTQLYDLKGVRRNRSVEKDRPVVYKKVLPDENFVDRVPVHVRPHDLRRFLDALTKDVSMLSSNGVIDYSLLLAFDDTTLSIRAALIDYVHQFDFIKRVESGAKKMYQSPTVLPPIPYKDRFLEAMSLNFNSRHVLDDALHHSTSSFDMHDDDINDHGKITVKVKRSRSDIAVRNNDQASQTEQGDNHRTAATDASRPRSVSDTSHSAANPIALVSIVE
ncbi:hypothetical protein H310_02031 [Aphanomyces invadans]|uniref:PIPK domain-containing protein n=1 Tax=Aphanomyces invadans TaxID=157072 RepID=A0A024UML0_9STRA|nr:hypothetical protein H310_02031 [Aphanomyces invadans]ETW07534.1 hypothetical protein H310_02031 [Aphanomyces invadans]|eukprot:XP_008863627.1 hypothetical protein H310_02031 [Aphanomyces invadans]